MVKDNGSRPGNYLDQQLSCAEPTLRNVEASATAPGLQAVEIRCLLHLRAASSPP